MNRTRTATVAATLAALVLAGTIWMLAHAAAPPRFHGTALPEAREAPAFTLVSHTGDTRVLADYRGAAVLLFFGFSNCPDVCPLTLNRLTRLREQLGRRAGDLQILLVTVDPERDTPATLAEYVARFGPGLTGLTGDEATLAEVRRGYGVYAAPAPPANADPHAGHAAGEPTGRGAIAHTDAVFGIDRGGRLRVLIAPDAPEDHVAADIATLLRL